LDLLIVQLSCITNYSYERVEMLIEVKVSIQRRTKGSLSSSGSFIGSLLLLTSLAKKNDSSRRVSKEQQLDVQETGDPSLSNHHGQGQMESSGRETRAAPGLPSRAASRRVPSRVSD
jgi:hypothetical protein